MPFVLTRDPQEFASQAGRFIAGRIECNVLGTVLMSVLDGVYGEVSPLFAYAPAGEGDVQAIALRLPPWLLLTSELDQSMAEELIELWLSEDPAVPGVNGTPASARAIAGAWTRHTGGTTRCRMREAMHVLEAVHDPARPARGQLRVATASDRELLIDWLAAFAHEAGVIGSAQSGTIVDARLEREGLLVWEDREPVSLVGRRGSRAWCGSDRCTRLHSIADTDTPAAPSRRQAAGRSRTGPAGACCSPTSPTRLRTRSTLRSATAGSQIGMSTTSRLPSLRTPARPAPAPHRRR
jgi:hypothetical protein